MMWNLMGCCGKVGYIGGGNVVFATKAACIAGCQAFGSAFFSTIESLVLIVKR